MCSSSLALNLFLEAPQDDGNARGDIYYRPELKTLKGAYSDIVRNRLSLLKFDDVAKIFGLQLDRSGAGAENSGAGPAHRPADVVLPTFAPNNVGLSGLVGAVNLAHTDLHAAGDTGYVEFYYQSDGVTLQSVVLYFRADGKFVPLASTNDFSKRLEWEKAKFAAVTQWLDEHVPQTDLGVVVVSESHPTRISVGEAAAFVQVIRQRPFSQQTNVWYSISVSRKEPDPKGRENSHASRTYRPGDSFGFSMDGKLYRMRPVLDEQPDLVR
jgi:hypothetical protein